MTLKELYAQLEPIIQKHHEELTKEDVDGNAASSLLNFCMATLLKAAHMNDSSMLDRLAFVVGIHMITTYPEQFRKKNSDEPNKQ